MRTALHSEFDSHIDLSTIEATNPGDIEKGFLTRALAALAVRRITGCSSEIAAAAIIDGRRDQGIDAVAFGSTLPELILVQAKWSDRGVAGLNKAAAVTMIDGFQQIESRQLEAFNDRLRQKSDRINSILQDPEGRIILVLALFGPGDLSEEVEETFQRAKNDFNTPDPFLDYRVMNASDFLRQIKEDLAGPSIALDIPMNSWSDRQYPNRAVQGTVHVEDVAGWYAEHGDRLFERNVRKALGITAVNQEMINTLKDSPDTFWYRNNGITVLCSKIEQSFMGSRRKPGEPITLRIESASVVNGAQTVHSIFRAYQQDPESTSNADVSVRVIQADLDDQLAIDITQSTNTQNRMERRDFVALDPVQEEIRDEFSVSLGKRYVFKRGEVEPTADSGCSIVQAAIALACAHRNPDLAMRARNPDVLWERGPDGAYQKIFGSPPAALVIWRSVQIFRAVTDALGGESRKLQGRGSAIADQGATLVAHVIFQLIGIDGLEVDDSEWSVGLGRVKQSVHDSLSWLIYLINYLYGSNSFVLATFNNQERFRELARQVVFHLNSGAAVPKDLAAYRPARNKRSRPAAHVLVDAGRIADGTPLYYEPISERERTAMAAWLAGDPERGVATWVSDRRKPLLWAGDRQHYSPTGLVTAMWALAGWSDAPIAVQGTRSWRLGNSEGPRLIDLAHEIKSAGDE